MAEVVSLSSAREARAKAAKHAEAEAAKANEELRWEGLVRCIGCHHEWEASAPTGTVWVNCPKCGFDKGHPKYPFGASPGDLTFVCSYCHGEALTAFKHKNLFFLLCMGCGADHTEAVYG